MRKKSALVWRILIILIFLIFVYNSKRSDYENDIAFFEKDCTGEIVKIKTTRGTKVYFTNKDFFYLNTYKGVKLNKGDSFQKLGTEVTVFEKSKSGKIIFKGSGLIVKPEESYFKFFFKFN